MIGPKVYKLLGSWLAPSKLGEKSYDELVERMTAHYNPEPAQVVERHKFYTRQQRQGENISTFVSELRTIANFGETLEKKEIVTGVREYRIQRRILMETK